MKIKKLIRSLRQSDADTADKIMNDYPIGCNTDKTFNKSFEKYLAQKDITLDGETDFCGETESGCETIEEKRHFRRFFKTGKIALATTAYIAAFILIMNIADKAPFPANDSPDGLINQNMTAIQSEINEKDAIPKRETSSKNSEKSSKSATTAEIPTKNTVAASVSAENPTAAEPEDQPVDVQIPHDVQIPSNVLIPHDVQIPSSVQPPEPTEKPTKPAETSNTAIADTTMDVHETTEPPGDLPMGGVPPTQSGGYFEIQYGAYDYHGERWDELIFVPADDNVDIREHSFEVEGFAINSKDPLHNLVTLEDENGVLFPIYIFTYEEFSMVLNPEIESHCQFFQLDGKEVCREFLNINGALEMTAWDDGCHICFTFASRENYDKVEFLIRNLS